MTTRTSSARWQGDLKSGNGTFAVGSGAFSGEYTFATRFEEKPGTNPEELLGAAHAACFSMSLANILAQDGATVNSIETDAAVHLERVDGSPRITKVVLTTVGDVPGLDQAAFAEKAEAAKVGCPVSNLFTGAEITLEATLRG